MVYLEHHMRQFFLIIFYFLLLTSCNVYQRTKHTYSIQLENGDIKDRGKVTTKQSTKSDQFSYYRRWDNKLIDYHENGEIKSIHISHFKIGTYGRPCKELLYKYTEYSDKGVKIYESKDICDCRKSKVVQYNKNGKVISKRVLKVKRFE